MAGNKTGIQNAQVKADADFAKTLLKIVAVGVAGGAALIGGAKALGETITEKQKADYERLEARREADREEVRRIAEAEEGKGE